VALERRKTTEASPISKGTIRFTITDFSNSTDLAFSVWRQISFWFLNLFTCTGQTVHLDKVADVSHFDQLFINIFHS
jgi:hypothetical protein